MLKEYLSTLANKFREIIGETDKINAQDFADKIVEVYEKGKAEGGNTEEAYNKGVADGKQAEYDRFWNLYQPNGNDVTDYGGAFSGPRWNDATFTPKYDIVPNNAQQMFWNTKITDLVAIEERQGIKIDFSKCTALVTSFQYAAITRIGEISARKCFFNATFANSANLQIIERLIVNEDTTFSNTFINTVALANIFFEGVIGKNGLNLSYSPLLTHDSLMSVINCLKDYSNTSGYTVTLGSTNLAKLTDTEKAIATQKGWTIA